MLPTSWRSTPSGWALRLALEAARRGAAAVFLAGCAEGRCQYRRGDLSAAENLHFFARLFGLDRREERVESALKQVGLAARQRDPVRTFSRGMTQRLTIARATLHEPDVLLFDEPYTGLDQEASALLDDLLRHQAAQGRTILMITHDLVHGLNLADRVAILDRGKIAAVATGREMEPAAFLRLYTDVTRRKRDR